MCVCKKAIEKLGPRKVSTQVKGNTIMPVSLQELVDEIVPERTILILGAGASIPSDAPSVNQLVDKISDVFKISAVSLTLEEIAGLAERKRNRRDLIQLVRDEFKGLRPKGSILNLPLYGWKSIFSTNYDELVEDSYERVRKPLTIFSSNFDFTIHTEPNSAKLFKIHGTISKDVADGHSSRMILTDLDYDLTQDFREALYSRLAADMTSGAQVLIIGQSLADNDLRELVQKAILINQKAMAGGRIALLLYNADQDRASLLETRGLRVAFGGLDDFFIRLAKKSPDHVVDHHETGDLLDLSPGLRPVTLIVEAELIANKADVSAIFNGWPARYADIARGFTFDRNVATELSNRLRHNEALCAVLLGASGVGKTSAARQALLRLRGAGFFAWEHKSDHPISPDHWFQIAQLLVAKNAFGVLFVDDAHSHLYGINDLVDRLAAINNRNLKLLLVSTRNHWGPRVKTPNIYANGNEVALSQLAGPEIDRLLTLVETVPSMRALVEAGFGGFSRYEQRRRLVDRCEADMFVCLKNIFATEKFDDIILREYSGLANTDQEIYRFVAAMEHAGIRVHRQLVIRLLGIKSSGVSAALSSLRRLKGKPL
jgi:hypothetical protein